jgi:aminodeoxyfutalosine deaminase
MVPGAIERLALKARYVFPVAGAPIADGFVTIHGERIESVGTARPDCEVRDLGDAAILPGLVNAHTHLEFSDLNVPLGQPGMSLPDWIRQVMGHRRDNLQPAIDRVQRGLAQSLSAGATLVGEIAVSDWRREVLSRSRPRPAMRVFHESIAPTTDRVASAVAAAEAFVGAETGISQTWPGLSPHAPYTVHPTLLSRIVDASVRFQVPVAMHLAESREELELLHTRGGPFRTLLKDLDAWDPRLAARLSSVGDYLRELARAPRALVIHGNYLSNEEVAFLSERAATMTVVYCPRTHHFFRHGPYPLAEMLASGVTIALGTDSRASNPDLSIFDEMCFVALHHPHVDRATILSLGTLNGAQALGLDHDMGSLAPGKLANLAVVQLGGTDAADPHELLLAGTSHVAQTWVNGETAS